MQKTYPPPTINKYHLALLVLFSALVAKQLSVVSNRIAVYPNPSVSNLTIVTNDVINQQL
jgi:hypothetical protein